MASTSFLLSTHTIVPKFFGPALPPPHLRNLRVSAGFGSVSRGRHNASQAVPSLYEVMGIPADATCREIKSAYRKLARVLHPDVSASKRGEEFMRVHAAYVTLSDPEKRAEYDDSVLRRWPEAMVSSYCVYSKANRRSRTWETDQCW